MIRGISGSMLKRLLDWSAAVSMEACDVFIGMSGLCVASARAARDRGAKVFLERGSRHVLSQKAILESIPGHRKVSISASDVEREIAGYEIADVIVVPSRHAEKSFHDAGVSKDRLFRNPYGVDLEMFAPTPKPVNSRKTVITAGAWSLQKGCDLLWQACEGAASWRLLHVGSVADAPLPNSDRFEHRAAVTQWKLSEQFATADVMALASRQDGFGLVMAQALACGLPVVCTDRTGGTDLREMLDEPNWITVVPHDDAEALRRGIGQALTLAETQAGSREVLGGARERLSWAAYGRRYNEELVGRCLQ